MGDLLAALLFFLDGETTETFDWDRLPGVGEAIGGILAARLSSRTLMLGGIGTLWTMWTARQSAAWMKDSSSTSGGLQQPGHPGLL